MTTTTTMQECETGNAFFFSAYLLQRFCFSSSLFLLLLGLLSPLPPEENL